MSRRNEVKADKMYYVYILQSIKEPLHFYVGFTADLKQRLVQHNSGYSAHTNKYKPWKIKSYFAFDNEQTARNFEHYLKSSAGREFIKRHF